MSVLAQARKDLLSLIGCFVVHPAAIVATLPVQADALSHFLIEDFGGGYVVAFGRIMQHIALSEFALATAGSARNQNQFSSHFLASLHVKKASHYWREA